MPLFDSLPIGLNRYVQEVKFEFYYVLMFGLGGFNF